METVDPILFSHERQLKSDSKNIKQWACRCQTRTQTSESSEMTRTKKCLLLGCHIYQNDTKDTNTPTNACIGTFSSMLTDSTTEVQIY